jgi:hypothetical protein
MKLTKWAAAALVVLAGFGIQRAMAESNLETPSYSLVKADNAFEIRSYDPYVVAEVTVAGDRAQASSKGFEILAGYIFGANRSRQKADQPEKMPMTSPVTQEPEANGEWKIRFVMPKSHTLETLPIAKDTRIKFFQTEKQTYLALRFSGGWGNENLEQHRTQLIEYAKSKAFKTIGEPLYAFYNAPFVPSPLRRNEVLIRVSP